jgi:hypothetical protein
MMLQQKRVALESPRHKDLGFAVANLARDQLPSSSPLLFPVNNSDDIFNL